MKVLFIARTYPPIIGGMQRFASDFYNNYKKLGKIDLLANPGGNKNLIYFFFKTLIFLIVNSGRYDVIHFSDAILSPLVLAIRIFSNAKISFTVHGLDIVYTYFGYQKIIMPFLRKADRVFAVSQHTMEQCKTRGVSPEKLMVIPNCMNFDREDNEDVSEIDGQKLFAKFNIDPRNKKILLTVGRLIKRKGHAWFLKNVFKQLPNNYIYLIAGLGPEYDTLKSIVNESTLAGRAYLLGHISDSEKQYLYQIADLFIMPNISVQGDQEGFGIVLLEAGSHGLPVIAANLEGIRDAVIDGKTGHLVNEKDVEGFQSAILDPNFNNQCVKNIVIGLFDCANIVKMYHNEFEKMSVV
jgi:phosphatidyl-myo-inositol dimannoside synthase